MRLFVLILLLLLFNQLNANTINGVVLDENKNPVEFSNVILHKSDDPAYINGTTTDSLGKFELSGLEAGNYFLEIVYVGYKTDTLPSINLQDNETKVLEYVELEVAANMLKGVEITSSKPVIERKADRIIYNVENSAKSSGESVMDLLRSVPGVTVSGNDQIRINGKNEVQVMINGKVEQLNADQLANLLKSIQSSNVKKIEVVSNPSAKYDANAKGGILEIQLKTNLKTGVTGSVYANYRQNKFAGTETGFNLSVNHKKLTLSTLYNFSYGKNFNDKTFIRNFSLPDAEQQYNESSYSVNKFIGQYANASLKYAINEHNSIGMGGEFFSGNNPGKTSAYLNIYNNLSNGIINETQQTLNLSDNTILNPSLNVNYKGILDTSGSKLDISYDYTYFKLHANSHLNTAFLDSNLNEFGTRLDFKQNNPFIVNLNTAKIDYTKPLKNKHALEIGAKFTWTKTYNDIRFSNLIDDEYVNDVDKSNEFRYIENINAVYTTWSKEWKRGWSTNLGLRMEQTNTNQYSITLNNRVKQHYIDFFPSAFIQKMIKEKHNINVNYSRKIHRPDFKDLNPFLFFNSQYSIWTGNANLKPEYINVTELTYTFDNAYSFFVGHENIGNSYTYLARQNDSTKITTYQATNFNVRNNLNFGFNINKELFSWWTISYSAQYTFFRYNAVVNDIDFKMNSHKFNISMDNTFNLPKDFQINLFAFYTSPHLDATDIMKSNGMVNLSVSKAFFDKKLKIRLFGNDLFNTMNFSFDTNFSNINSTATNKWGSRFAGLSATYNFQKGKKFQNARTSKSNEEEKGRIQ